MPPKGKKGGASKKKSSLYKKPPPIPPGEKLRDTNGRSWIIGPSIGVGGFGEIYSACEYSEGTYDKSVYPYVVKIEPIENGPLFVECNFYKRNYNENDIADFMDSRGLSQLGMPAFLGTGEHWLQEGKKKTHLRFLILERYGTDINKKFKECGRFPASTVFLLGLQVLDVLEYVHSRSYIHADIKGANILLGIQPGTEHQAYLLDFGLAWKVVGGNYKPDPKCAHEGTLEYTSTDRHIGAQTMRGDLEILAYNMLHWLTGSLPWEGIEDSNTVHRMKAQLVENVRDRIQRDYPNVPDHLFKFFEYIKTLDMPDVPNHASCRRIFESYLTSVGKTRQSDLEFPLLARNKITNVNCVTNNLTVKLIDIQIYLPKVKSKIVTTSAVSQEKGDKNQRKPIQRPSSKKPSMDSEVSNKLELNKFKPKSIKGHSPKTNSTKSTDSEELVLSKNKLTKETAIQKATYEFDEDFAYAVKLDKELNNESLGVSNKRRSTRNRKKTDRDTAAPAEITPKPCNNPIKKLKKSNRLLIPSSKANVSKDIDTPKNNNKSIELNNEIEDKEINRRVEKNKIKELKCSGSEIYEFDEDFAYAVKLDKELNNESLGVSNKRRSTRNRKKTDRDTAAPAEITPKPCNNPIKKLKKSNRLLIPSSKANVSKDIDTPKNNNKSIELNNEIEDKEINRRVEKNKIKELKCSGSEISIIDLDSTNELSDENVIENKELTSPEGKKTKLIVPKESLAVAPLQLVCEIEDISDQEKSYPKCKKIKKSTSLKIPEAKQKYLKNKKVDEVALEYESENDDLDGLPEVSFTSSHSKNSSMRSLRDDSIASASVRKNKILNKHLNKIEQEIEENHHIEVLRNDAYTSNKSKFSDPKCEPNTKREHDKPIYDEHVVDSSTDTVSAQSVYVDDQNITKTNGSKQVKRHKISKIMSSMLYFENETPLGNNHEREVENTKSLKQKKYTAEIQVSSIDITKNRVIKNQEDQQVTEKLKKNDKDRVAETTSQTQANDVMNQEDDDEPKSKKNKINEFIDTCTSESRDIDASHENDRESRYEWDNNFQPKLNKKNKNTSSETLSNTVKRVNADVFCAKQRNRHSEPDILSTIKNSEYDTLVGVNNESYKLNNTSELISSTDDIIENSIIEDQPNKRKHKKLTDKMSVTKTNNKSDLEKADGEFKSKKKKRNKSIDICTSEIEDTDGSRATKSSDFFSDVKQSECEDDDFQPKPDKNKKKYKSSVAYTSKSVDADPLLMDDAKDNRENEDGQPQAKKKKNDKSSYSSADDGINAYYCTRRYSSNFGKKVSEHTEQPELTDVPKTVTTNDITKKKKMKTKAREDSGSDGDFDSKYKSIPANKNKK